MVGLRRFFLNVDFVRCRHFEVFVLNKDDKKFIGALAFAQTGAFVITVVLSGQFWHHSQVELQDMKHLYEISQIMYKQNNELESKSKVEHIKNHYEDQGIGVSSDSSELEVAREVNEVKKVNEVNEVNEVKKVNKIN